MQAIVVVITRSSVDVVEVDDGVAALENVQLKTKS